MRLLGILLFYLPNWLFYSLSTGFAGILQHIVGYRKAVVISNISEAFPERTKQEQAEIAKAFYSHFADVLLETIALLAFKKGFLKTRITLENAELLDRLKTEGKSVVAIGGHTGNWEWLGTALASLTNYRVLAAYRPLSSQSTDSLMKKIREQEGTELVPSHQIYRTILKTKEPILVYLIADQAPHPDQAFWMSFLGRDTPVFWGPEKIARSKEFVVVYLAMKRIRRGHYQVELRELKDPHASEQPGAITAWHVQQLETDIRVSSEAWLWSHKRWKHKRSK
jgi:KDO2-lipid IV(A) lauroyltransferase